MKLDNIRPVTSIKHEDKRVAIPDSEHQGEEQAVLNGEPAQSEYDVFRHEFQRGRDPELYWLGKYANDDEETPDRMPQLRTDIRSLYKHEDVRPEAIIDNLYMLHEHREEGNMQLDLFGPGDFFDQEEEDELERLAGYYKHSDNWQNRLIQGDSLLVMNSLLNREGMKGQVQCVYMDPPYGIKYGGNWQMRINNTNVKENDGGISGEPEMIKAYRDTWELGIHSYLSYLRDRLVIARELLTESGSCFVQISDENVHLVRNLMDEVFGSENFVCLITFRKRLMPLGSKTLEEMANFIVWYAKDKQNIKYRQLYKKVTPNPKGRWTGVHENGVLRRFTKEEKENFALTLLSKPVFQTVSQWAPSYSESNVYDFEFEGKTYRPARGQCWLTPKAKMDKLAKMGRLFVEGDSPRYVMLHDDFPYSKLTSPWDDTAPAQDKKYVVQTSTEVIQRCILMTTDPGDLVLDPTCGSGTTAYVAEQWGRRWITMDTSRIALNIAKKRLITALYPYYKTHDESEHPNIRQGFKYKTVPHITLKSLANDLPADEEVLYDQPEEDKKRIRVSGPFTVETLQSHDVSSPESLNDKRSDYDEYALFTDRIFNNLRSNGIRNGIKQQQVVMHSVERLDDAYLNARAYYKTEDGQEHCVYIMIGPKFGTVSKHAVNEAIRAFRHHLDESNWLVLLGFSFEDTIDTKEYDFGTFQVSKVRMSDDLLQDGLLKKDKKAGSFIIIGEPDIVLIRDCETDGHVEIRGMDMYDPIQDEVKARNVNDIAYWEMDDEYTGSLFKVRSIHFCGGAKKEDFAAWRKGLTTVASDMAKKKAEHTLRLKFNEEVWERLYDFRSEPIKWEQGKKIAVRVVSQFGEESTKVLTME